MVLDFKRQGYKTIELCVLFVFLPIFIAFNPIVPLSLILIIIALGYVATLSRTIWGNGSWKNLWKVARAAFSLSYIASKAKPVVWRLVPLFVVFTLGSTWFVYYTMPDALFHVMFNNTLLWLAISLFYSVFSVMPQEFLYRVFFFERYGSLFPNKRLLVVLNAVVFCVAHVMFFNQLVLLLTFCGGLIFAVTYQQSRSFGVVSIEHSLYGVWLYTVGMGAMLAFPSGN